MPEATSKTSGPARTDCKNAIPLIDYVRFCLDLTHTASTFLLALFQNVVELKRLLELSLRVVLSSHSKQPVSATLRPLSLNLTTHTPRLDSV